MRPFPLLFFALMLAAGSLRAQSYSVYLHRLDGSDSSLAALLKKPAAFHSENEALGFVRRIPAELQEAGFLAASVDSFQVSGSQFLVQVFVGNRWHWARLSLADVPAALLASAGISEAQFSGVPLRPKALAALTNRMLDWCDEHGYPFARAGLDSIRNDSADGISARLLLSTGPLKKIDSIILEGDVRLSQSYLRRYLDIRPGMLYSESQLRKLNLRLRELAFLDAGSAARVEFNMIDTRLHLRLKERRANLLNGIIGVQPGGTESSQLLLTVDAQAAFQNLLGQGESFSCSFQNLQPKSPRIKASAIYPFMLGTPFGADGNFDLYFRSTEFRRSSAALGLRYAVNATDFFRLYYSASSNRVITPDTAFVVANHRLPDNIDVSSAGGGFELGISRIDYRPNPSRGWTFRASTAALRRSVMRNDGIAGINDGSGFDYGKLYDTLAGENTQIQARADASFYIPLAKRIVLKCAYCGGWMSGERLFQNELFQLGGFHLLRGFDEESLYANQYHVGTAELRLLLGANSNFYVFSDNAWLQTNIDGFRSAGLYIGVGIGTSLETKSGVFTIACALGKSPSAGFQWRQAKIHVGYAAYF